MLARRLFRRAVTADGTRASRTGRVLFSRFVPSILSSVLMLLGSSDFAQGKGAEERAAKSAVSQPFAGEHRAWGGLSESKSAIEPRQAERSSAAESAPLVLIE